MSNETGSGSGQWWRHDELARHLNFVATFSLKVLLCSVSGRPSRLDSILQISSVREHRPAVSPLLSERPKTKF